MATKTRFKAIGSLFKESLSGMCGATFAQCRTSHQCSSEAYSSQSPDSPDSTGSREGTLSTNSPELIYYYDLEEVALSFDLERNASNQQLVCQDSHCPEVYPLIVLLPRQYLRRDIERSPAEGIPKCVCSVYSPPEVANLGYSLSGQTSTNWIRMFSGLRSLWSILW